MTMKKLLNITLAGSMLVAAAALTACSDSFLEEKIDYNKTGEGVYNNYAGAQGRVNDLYRWAQPGGSKEATKNANINMGEPDQHSQSTEEYAGLSQWVHSEYNMNTVNNIGSGSLPDWFEVENKVQSSPWGCIRNINDVIRGIENGSLSQSEKNELLGQAYFWRAWSYYKLVKWYGGVPIIKEVLLPVEGPSTPRSSARECFEFIFDDLDTAAALLEEATGNGGWSNPAADWGRVTTGTALALKGRVMNLWASPLFNRKNDPSRWEAAYKFQNEALSRIKACGYDLVTGSLANAGDWADLFVRQGQNPEAVFVTLYSTYDDTDYAMHSSWEQNIRPKNAGGSGRRPSKTMVDLFPMKDGKLPSTYTAYTNLPKSEIAYDAQCPWMNRDPRFYRTFAFPGVRWVYNGTPSDSTWPADAGNYTLWSYVWYLESSKDQIEDNRMSSTSHGSDGNTNAYGFYVRKRTCDTDISQQNYVYNANFSLSATPWMEIRFTEVLLNLAEAAAMAGHTEVAVEQLRAIRSRVGYEGDCGIAGGMDQKTAVAAVLYERQIELAYEGKRFDDMRRWMLFDGGATQPSGAPSAWAVDGWGGNTCSWLGFRAFNGSRRDAYEFRVTINEGIGEDRPDGDPIDRSVRPAGVDLRLELDPQLETLKQFYTDYLTVKVLQGADGYNAATGEDYFVQYRPHYYFLGLANRALNENPTLTQTIGWEDNLHSGAPGTFDPLAETAE